MLEKTNDICCFLNHSFPFSEQYFTHSVSADKRNPTSAGIVLNRITPAGPRRRTSLRSLVFIGEEHYEGSTRLSGALSINNRMRAVQLLSGVSGPSKPLKALTLPVRLCGSSSCEVPRGIISALQHCLCPCQNTIQNIIHKGNVGIIFVCHCRCCLQFSSSSGFSH